MKGLSVFEAAIFIRILENVPGASWGRRREEGRRLSSQKFC